MLNPQIISENIIFLRQRANLTQQELAAKTNVTHQAVSKWENGSSIPDLQTLMTLSRLFGVTIDELITETIAERREAEPAPVEPKTTAEDERTFEPEAPRADKTHAEQPPMSLSGLVGLAPFLGKDRLTRLVLEQIDDVTPENLVPLAPFLSRQALDEIAERMDFSSVTPGRLIALAPFMSKAALDGALRQIDPRSLTSGQLVGLAPFLSRETLAAAVDRLDPPASSAQLVALAPFLDSKSLGGIVSRIGDMTMSVLTTLAPFLPRKTIDSQLEKLRVSEPDDSPRAEKKPAPTRSTEARLALKLAEDGDFDEIEDIFARLDRQTSEQIVDMAIDADETDFLESVFSLLSGEQQRKIALYHAENNDFDEIENIFVQLNEQTRTQIVDMAIENDETDFLESVFNLLNGEQQRKIALHFAEDGDFDEIEDIFDRLDEETQSQIVDKALEEDETDFLKRVGRSAFRGRSDAAPRAEAAEAASVDKALLRARHGSFDGVAALIDRMTDAQKDEIVRLAIVFDDTDFLEDCVDDLPEDSVETLCFSLARMGEAERLEPFMARLRPESRERVEKILAERE